MSTKVNAENLETNVEVVAEAKESKIKTFASKIKSKLTVKNIAKVAIVGAVGVAGYVLGAKSKSNSNAESDLNVVDFDDYSSSEESAE